MRPMVSHRTIVKAAAAVLLLCCCLFASEVLAIDASDRYRSPRNPERKIRRSTELIVLHTTEAPARSSLNKLSDRGEAHYCVTEEGRVYRIVDRDREAFHAGRSMWRGKEDVDKFSIGIECVGYHNKPMGSVQIAAIRDLVAELKAMYGISDDRVVCHSHVAYGAPNKWHRRRHRGRKRCGMQFAMPGMRRALGLKSKPAYDTDVRAGRLVVGDSYLHKVLYGRVETVAGQAGKPENRRTPAPKPAKNWFSRLLGGSSSPKTKQETEPKKTISKPSSTTPQPPKAALSASPPRSVAELKANGYAAKGTISRSNTAMKIAGRSWNRNDTYYLIKGKIIPGDKVDATKLGPGVSIWMKKIQQPGKTK